MGHANGQHFLFHQRGYLRRTASGPARNTSITGCAHRANPGQQFVGSLGTNFELAAETPGYLRPANWPGRQTPVLLQYPSLKSTASLLSCGNGMVLGCLLSSSPHPQTKLDSPREARRTGTADRDLAAPERRARAAQSLIGIGRACATLSVGTEAIARRRTDKGRRPARTGPFQSRLCREAVRGGHRQLVSFSAKALSVTN